MKKKGSVMIFSRQRLAEVHRAYRRLMGIFPNGNTRRIAAVAVESPASRFWVSVERAITVIRLIEAGADPRPSMRPLKRDMFSEIYRRYILERAAAPDDDTITHITRVIHSPAPRHYMKPSTFLEYLYRSRRRKK